MYNLKLIIYAFLTIQLVFLANISPAQVTTKLISGTVRNEKGDVLAGVSIVVKGSSVGTSTNEKGTFSLEVGSGGAQSLSFSFKGYSSQEIVISNQKQLEIVLKPLVEDLEEVVVIGYGTAKRKDLTGSVASIQATKLEAEAPRSVQDLLRGNAAGMIIGQSSTVKGDATLLVRGSGTLKAGSSPLNVVDGVIFDGTFADLNPNDIQSVDILKDASATAVYGAKAANGVVLITTKKGSAGKPKITFNGNLGFVENANMPRVMRGDEFLAYRYDYEMGKVGADYHQRFPEMFVDPRKLSQVSQLAWYNYGRDKDPATSVNEDQLVRTWLSRLELKSPEIENYMNNRITD